MGSNPMHGSFFLLVLSLVFGLASSAYVNYATYAYCNSGGISPDMMPNVGPKNTLGECTTACTSDTSCIGVMYRSDTRECRIAHVGECCSLQISTDPWTIALEDTRFSCNPAHLSYTWRHKSGACDMILGSFQFPTTNDLKECLLKCDQTSGCHGVYYERAYNSISSNIPGQCMGISLSNDRCCPNMAPTLNPIDTWINTRPECLFPTTSTSPPIIIFTPAPTTSSPTTTTTLAPTAEPTVFVPMVIRRTPEPRHFVGPLCYPCLYHQNSSLVIGSVIPTGDRISECATACLGTNVCSGFYIETNATGKVCKLYTSIDSGSPCCTVDYREKNCSTVWYPRTLCPSETTSSNKIRRDTKIVWPLTNGAPVGPPTRASQPDIFILLNEGSDVPNRQLNDRDIAFLNVYESSISLSDASCGGEADVCTAALGDGYEQLSTIQDDPRGCTWCAYVPSYYQTQKRVAVCVPNITEQISLTPCPFSFDRSRFRVTKKDILRDGSFATGPLGFVPVRVIVYCIPNYEYDEQIPYAGTVNGIETEFPLYDPSGVFEVEFIAHQFLAFEEFILRDFVHVEGQGWWAMSVLEFYAI